VATTDPIILRVREAFTASGLTLDELGTKMGYEGDVARKSAWQFLNKTADPRLSMLRRFAGAVGVPLADLIEEGKPKGKKP
jgi:transcriptional regulator with XRE-family HTH domain